MNTKAIWPCKSYSVLMHSADNYYGKDVLLFFFALARVINFKLLNIRCTVSLIALSSSFSEIKEDNVLNRSSPPDVFLGKGVLETCGSKFRGKHPRRSVMLSNFTELTLRHWCLLIDLLHIFRTPFYKKIYGGLLLIEEKHLYEMV